MTYLEFAEECTYLAGLLEARGDGNVPKASIPSYLKLQAGNADGLGFTDLAAAMRSTIAGGDGDTTFGKLTLAFRSVAHALCLSAEMERGLR